MCVATILHALCARGGQPSTCLTPAFDQVLTSLAPTFDQPYTRRWPALHQPLTSLRLLQTMLYTMLHIHKPALRCACTALQPPAMA